MKQIVIAQRGWVFVGEVERSGGDDVTITNAKCIRRWGTTKGLGELALNGPLKSTVLDPMGTVRLHTTGRSRIVGLRGREVVRALIDSEAVASSDGYGYGYGYGDGNG